MSRREREFSKELDRAIKARILEEIQRKKESQIVNNLYGSGGGSLQERMPQMAEPVDEPFDYFVDIERTPGKEPGSWSKRVRRYREPK
jgi:hypothetical protein